MIQSLLLLLMSCFVNQGNAISTATNDEAACALPAPKNLHWELAGTSYLQIAWDPVPGAAFYRIYFYRASDGMLIDDKLVLALPEKNIALVDNLQGGASVFAVAKSICANGIESPKVD